MLVFLSRHWYSFRSTCLLDQMAKYLIRRYGYRLKLTVFVNGFQEVGRVCASQVREDVMANVYIERHTMR